MLPSPGPILDAHLHLACLTCHADLPIAEATESHGPRSGPGSPSPGRRRRDRLYTLVTRWVAARRDDSPCPEGAGVNWRLLVADYSNLGLRDPILKAWPILDTFDMLAPRYGQPTLPSTFRRWLDEAGLADVEVEQNGHGVVGRARVPA